MPFNFSSPEYLSPHKRRKNRVSSVSRASPAHTNSPLLTNGNLHAYIKYSLHKHVRHVFRIKIFAKREAAFLRHVNCETAFSLAVKRDPPPPPPYSISKE